MSNDAGWRNDPYGRYQLRYWDGTMWTEHVATGGEQSVDPMGASPVVPFATPPTAFPAPGAGGHEGGDVDSTVPRIQGLAAPLPAPLPDPAPGSAAATDPAPDPAGPAGPATGGVVGLLERMGDAARERPRPSLRAAVAGAGGALIGGGILATALGDDPSRGTVIVLGLLLMIGAWVLRRTAKVAELQAAAVGAVVVGIPVFAGGVAVDGGRNGFLASALGAVLFIAAWALPGFRGRTLLLGLGALLALSAVGALTAPSTSTERCEEYLAEGDYDRYFEECESAFETSVLPIEVTENLGRQGMVWLFGAALYLGLTWWLDRRGFQGAATGLCASGLLGALVGTLLLVEEFGSTGGPLLVCVVGVLVCLVGSHGARRATTWWGALLTATGVTAFVVVQMEPDSTGAIGGALLVAGLLLVAIPFVGRALRSAARQDDGAAPLSDGSAARL